MPLWQSPLGVTIWNDVHTLSFLLRFRPPYLICPNDSAGDLCFLSLQKSSGIDNRTDAAELKAICEMAAARNTLSSHCSIARVFTVGMPCNSSCQSKSRPFQWGLGNGKFDLCFWFFHISRHTGLFLYCAEKCRKRSLSRNRKSHFSK